MPSVPTSPTVAEVVALTMTAMTCERCDADAADGIDDARRRTVLPPSKCRCCGIGATGDDYDDVGVRVGRRNRTLVLSLPMKLTMVTMTTTRKY
jgi:hypothetical protein